MKRCNPRRGKTQNDGIKQVILNLIQDLQRGWLSFVNSVRGRLQIKFAMTPLWNKGGFTLIELLVVVLIIGILAAIALPQYQKAVEKTRVTEAIATLDTINKIFDMAYLYGYKGTLDILEEQVGIKLNGGSWSDVGILGGPVYNTKNFQYVAECANNDQCMAFAIRTTAEHELDENSYYLLGINRESEEKLTKRACVHFNTTRGKYVCDGLVSSGWAESSQANLF